VRQPNKGVYVISFTEQDVRETFSLRARLESMAFEWAIPNITNEDMAQLRALVKEQESAIAERKYDELARLDMRFHELICLKAGHSRLLKIWYELHAQGQMLLNLRFRQMADYTPKTVTEDHLKILDAIERGDIDSAVRLTNTISERVIDECIETLVDLTASEEAVSQ
jgi:DNA-binding GntR family transcriptional regulator